MNVEHEVTGLVHLSVDEKKEVVSQISSLEEIEQRVVVDTLKRRDQNMAQLLANYEAVSSDNGKVMRFLDLRLGIPDPGKARLGNEDAKLAAAKRKILFYLATLPTKADTLTNLKQKFGVSPTEALREVINVYVEITKGGKNAKVKLLEAGARWVEEEMRKAAHGQSPTATTPETQTEVQTPDQAEGRGAAEAEGSG